MCISSTNLRLQQLASQLDDTLETAESSSQIQFFRGANRVTISAFNDLSLFTGTPFEISTVITSPRWSHSTYSISVDALDAPIQRCEARISDSFMHHGWLVNSGIAPRTWSEEGPGLQVYEVGDVVADPFQVIKVKVLGAIKLGGWKILTVHINDEMANEMSGIEDLKRCKPGYLKGLFSWAKSALHVDVKELETLEREDAWEMVLDCHMNWKATKETSNSIEEMDLINTNHGDRCAERLYCM